MSEIFWASTTCRSKGPTALLLCSSRSWKRLWGSWIWRWKIRKANATECSNSWLPLGAYWWICSIKHPPPLLKTELKHYSPEVTCCAYITKPFSVDTADVLVGTGEQEEIIDTQADETTKTKHNECTPLNFWVSLASSNSTLAHHAVPKLLIFRSMWECEQGFSALMATKSKSRNRLAAPGHDFRCAVSKVMSRIDQLVEKKQIQPSHWVVFVVDLCVLHVHSFLFFSLLTTHFLFFSSFCVYVQSA